LYVYLVGKLKI